MSKALGDAVEAGGIGVDVEGAGVDVEGGGDDVTDFGDMVVSNCGCGGVFSVGVCVGCFCSRPLSLDFKFLMTVCCDTPFFISLSFVIMFCNCCC